MKLNFEMGSILGLNVQALIFSKLPPEKSNLVKVLLLFIYKK